MKALVWEIRSQMPSDDFLSNEKAIYLIKVHVDIMILVARAKLIQVTVLKRRQCAKINGVWNSSTPTKISLRHFTYNIKLTQKFK